MEMDDNKRRRNMILYVLIAFVVYLVLSTVLFPNIGHTQQITKTDYSTFVKALDKKSVDRVEYNTDDYTIYYTKKGEDENIAYKTTGVPNDAGFTDRVLESGASLESVVPDKNSGLMTYYLLTLILPMAIFFLIGWWLNRRMKKAMGDDGPSMNFGGGGFGGVECNLQLEKMKLLQEVQEDLDAESPEVESVSPVLSSRDMEVLGEYLTHQDEADHEKAMQAARVLFSIRQTSLIDVFLSNMENSAIVEELIDRFLDEDGNPKPLKVKDGNEPSDNWRKYI